MNKIKEFIYIFLSFPYWLINPDKAMDWLKKKMDKDTKKRIDELIRQLEEEMPEWWIEYNNEYSRIEFRKELQVEVPTFRISLQTIQRTEEKDFPNMVKGLGQAIKRVMEREIEKDLYKETP